MTPRRRRSPLEDEDLFEINEPSAASGGDLCEQCGCTRTRHKEDGCACGRCDGFEEDFVSTFDST